MKTIIKNSKRSLGFSWRNYVQEVQQSQRVQVVRPLHAHPEEEEEIVSTKKMSQTTRET